MPRSKNSSPGHRILVYGVTASGKSTAAARIAARTGLPLTLGRAHLAGGKETR